MSKCNNMSGGNLRWQLLTSASVLAMVGTIMGASNAAAADADRPVLWIELGGQLARTDRGADLPAPPFENSVQAPMPSPVSIDRPPLYDFGGFAGISFQPSGSDWIFSAKFQYGRSSGHKNVDVQSSYRAHNYIPHARNGYYNSPANIVDVVADHHEQHSIIDFQAGKDVGLGLFGADASSVLGLGVRFAQFSSVASTDIKAKPDTQFYNGVPPGFPPSWNFAVAHYHEYGFGANTREGFHGVGPAISWNASQPIAGNKESSELALDFGLNAALLFGRQRAFVHHETKAGYVQDKYYPDKYRQLYSNHPPDRARSRSVTVPNIGGFAGISFRYADAKVSFGYRGDFFFGALDTGVNKAKRTTLGFSGPYASISVGLGD